MHLNHWFYHFEMSPAGRKELTLAEFRACTASDSDIPMKKRYLDLMEALKKETEYNEELGSILASTPF